MTVVEFWVEQYQAVVAEKKALGDKLRETLDENKKLQERLDKSIADRSELQADRDIWFRKNGEKQAEIEELKKKIESLNGNLDFVRLCRDNWLDRAKKAEKELEEIKGSRTEESSRGSQKAACRLHERLSQEILHRKIMFWLSFI